MGRTLTLWNSTEANRRDSTCQACRTPFARLRAWRSSLPSYTGPLWYRNWSRVSSGSMIVVKRFGYCSSSTRQHSASSLGKNQKYWFVGPRKEANREGPVSGPRGARRFGYPAFTAWEWMDRAQSAKDGIKPRSSMTYWSPSGLGILAGAPQRALNGTKASAFALMSAAHRFLTASARWPGEV